MAPMVSDSRRLSSGRLLEQLVPSIDGVRQARSDGVAASSRPRVDVASEVGDLDEVVELIADERHEGVAQLTAASARSTGRWGAVPRRHLRRSRSLPGYVDVARTEKATLKLATSAILSPVEPTSTSSDLDFRSGADGTRTHDPLLGKQWTGVSLTASTANTPSPSSDDSSTKDNSSKPANAAAPATNCPDHRTDDVGVRSHPRADGGGFVRCPSDATVHPWTQPADEPRAAPRAPPPPRRNARLPMGPTLRSRSSSTSSRGRC